MTGQTVSYSVETFLNEVLDFAQIAVKKFMTGGSGLLIPCAEDPTFAIINVTGKASEAWRTTTEVPTPCGFIIPSAMDIEVLRQEEAGRQFRSVLASNGAELNDQVLSSLDWIKWRIRSLEGWNVEGGPYGEPNPDPVAARIALGACQQWANGAENGLDDALLRILEVNDDESDSN